MIGKGGEAVVELATEGGDFFGVLRDSLLAPAVGGGFEEGDQGGGSGEQDFAVDGAVKQRGIRLERGGKEVIAGEKEHDEFGRGLVLFPIGFGAERINVGADFGGVSGEMDEARGIVGSIERIAVGLYRRFGVDDNLLAAGEPDEEVGAKFISSGGGGLLLSEIAVREHVSELDDATQLEFTPAAGKRSRAERGGKFGGLGLELELGGAEGFELFGERAVGGGAGFFEVGDFGVYFFERLFERAHEVIDGLLAGGEVGLGFLLKLGERGLGEFEEGGVVAGEGISAEGLEFGGEPLVCVGEGAEFFGGGGAFGSEGGVEGGGAGFGGAKIVLRGAEGGGESLVFVGEGALALGEGRGLVARPEEGDEGRKECSGEGDEGGGHAWVFVGAKR